MVYNWPYYGPRIVGGALILLILVLGYLFWRSTRQPQVTQQTNRLALTTTPTPAPVGGIEPVATVTLEETPTPTPAPTTKGGVTKLPETGFPLILAVPGLILSFAGGLALSRFRKS